MADKKANREKATAFILKYLDKILPGTQDVAQHKAFLEGLSDKAFEEYMTDLRSGKKYVTITAPNYGKVNLDLERNKKVADELGVKLFHRLWMPATERTPAYLTPNEYFVCKLPVRVASQRLLKKMSIPQSQKTINTLTGQATGASKGASISHPELRVCAAMGLEASMIELLKYRGGDGRGYAALSSSLMKTGKANLKSLSYFASGVESTNTIKTYLTSAHLKNTL